MRVLAMLSARRRIRRRKTAPKPMRVAKTQPPDIKVLKAS